MFLLAICLISLASLPESLCVKKFPTATRPPPPPPAPPFVVFNQPQAQAPVQTSQSEAPPQARLEYFELIAPNPNGQDYKPILTASNPDFNVVYRPRPTQQPQRPQRPQQQFQQPQRPQQQFQQPARPQQPQRPATPPLYQFPQPQRPQRPSSQAPTRPRIEQGLPTPGHRFGPQAFNNFQQQQG